MASVSAALGASAAPLTIEHDGKTYTASPVTQRIKSAFERWLVKRAAQVLEDLVTVLPADRWQALAKEHAKDVAGGVYAFGGAVANEALQSPQGILSFTALILGSSEDTILDLITTKGAAVTLALETLLAESMPEGAVTAEKGESGESPAGNASRPAA